MSGQVVEVSPRSRKEIRNLADAVYGLARRALGKFGDALPVVDVLELVLPTLDPDFELEIRSRVDMGENHGLTIPSLHTIRLREDVYERACEGHGRDRMTVAHELGHFLMHDEPAYARRIRSGPIPAYRNPEWQANCFGAELLIFRDGLRRDSQPAHIAKLRGVSIEAAGYQLAQYAREGLLR